VRRLIPRSLLGQMLLLMGAALLVAQLVNLSFLLTEQQKLSLAQNEGPVVVRFAQVARIVAAAPPAEREALLDSRLPGPMAAYSIDPESLIDRAGLVRDREIERHLGVALGDARVPAGDMRAAARNNAAQVPPPHRDHRGPFRAMHDGHRILFLSVRLDDGRWLNGRLQAPHPDPWLIHQMLLATTALFVLVFGAVIWIARRLARPLRELTEAAERFEGRAEPDPVQPRGPSDIRRAIEAFNAMNRRTLALLDEKDRMLGAIGHDMRTPLASLRVRVESMEPAEEREKLVETIEGMAAMLEDILVLARTGRAREPVRRVDVAALADALVEDYCTLGSDVRFEDGSRAVADVQPELLRRAVRNLIDNAVAYAGGAEVSVRETEAGVEIAVEDEGPGIPEERLADVLEPFKRLDESRSRDTGGAGLGLAIARAVAQAHGGSLTISNRASGGLRACLAIPT
jgi:signal transduction histidine kinase